MARKFMDRLKRSKAFNLFLALMLTVSTLPVQAFAAESADVQSRMSGTCYVQCVRSAWDGGTLFNLTMPDGQVIQGYCLNPGWPTPVDGNYPFTAVDRGDGTYIVTVATSYITSDINQIHPFDHGHMVGRPPWRTQTVGNAIWAVLRYGKISLHKQSANPGCTDGNALYSLAGAEYGIYSDPGCTQWVATMVTDAAGNATSGDLKTGTYYVKEGKASEGFQVDPTVYTVNVAANATVAVNNGVVYETPINDPAGVIIAKYDGDKSYNANNLPQGSASLEGAEFTVRYYDGFYDTEQQAEASGAPTRTWVFRTNKNGTISLQYSDLVSGDPLYEMNGIRVFPRGTLVIRETKAPDGYNLNTDFVSVQKIKAPGDASTESTYNTPKVSEEVKRGGVSVQKLDAQTGSKPQGGASFEGITFSIINNGDNDVMVDGVSYAKGQVVKTITTDAKGFASTTGDCLPFGKYIIRETSGNGGYLVTAPDIHATVSEDGKIYSFTAKDEIARGGVKVSKRDLESGLPTSLGAANLDGTRFEVKSLNEDPVICGGVTFQKGEVITELTIKNGEASTAADLLPFGRYTIQEVAVGDGYLLTDGKAHEFDISKDGQIVNGVEGAVKNQVKRGDLEFVKVSEADMSRLAGVPFRITSETTGESHVIVTDENGYASTAAEWNKHTHKTNANDTAAEEDLDSEAGIWFGLAKDGKTVPANDKLGALPYDTYTVEELRCAANEGFVLVKIEGITVKRDSVTVDLGTIDDSLQTEAYIHTSARDGMDGDKLILPDEQAVVTDHVEFTGLVPGKAYTMRATLVDQKTGDVIGGPVEKGFTPAGQSGSVEMEITVDLLGYAGKKVVVFEELTCDGSTVCEHKDLDDTEQTLRVLKPSIGTTAKDGIDGDQQAVIDPEAVIVDTVSYKNLVPGREYTVKGQLMVKSTGEPLKDKDGKPVTAEAKFTPADTTGTVDLDFTFDGSALKGESVVAFETLYRGDKELAAHADIDDEGQTVEFTKPSIGTTAKDGVDGDQHSATDPEAVIVDTVSYKNLVPGREYTVKGKLMLKSTGDPLLNENGKEYTAETKFTPDGTYGTVDVTFTFDATDLDGESVVVFETLYRGGTKICAHADIDDEGQTVEFAKPSIGTTAKDGIDGDQQAVIDPEAVIVDTVAYTGLIPGKEYTVKGKLMDKETGEALKVDGKAVTAEATFTPDHPSGTVDVTFEFDASALAGKKVVAFETLYRLGKKVSAHADIDDEGQTVEFTKPSIGTTAKDGVDGDKFAIADGKATLVDTISYTGLIPGKEYKAVGKIMNKETGEALKGEDGKAVTAEATFTPDHDHGTVDVTFTFDCLQLAGQQVVAFETLYRLDKEICAHADIDDMGQTVTIIQPTVKTAAIDGIDGDKDAVIDPEAVISDKVLFDRVIPGASYEVHGIVMDAETGLPLLSGEGEGDAPTADELADFWQQLVDLTGITVVAPLEEEAGPIAEEPQEKGFFDWLGSLFGADGKTDASGEEPTIEEMLDGVWFPPVKLDRKAIEALLADNPEIASRLIRSSAEITPKDSYGEADLDFTFDAAEMAGKDAVVFELLMKDGYAVAAHADITDENQTVSLFEPEIGTTAKDGVDGDHHAVIDPEAVIVDTISYKDLIPGKEYTVKGTLMVKSTGEPLLGEDGKPVTAETAFTPDHDHGTVDVTFEFDGSSLKGDSVVVFETLYRDGKEITAHADIDDEGQTVEFTEPSLGTTAEDGIDGDQSLVADGKAVIVDNVSYKGLVPGKEYKVVGTLMLKDTGEPLLDANGKSVTAETTFTPDHDHGTVDVTFTFDASLLAGQQVVVFETLYRLDKEITVHADIEDENQTIEVIQPGVDTVAVDGFDGDKDVVADPEAEITDTLSYKNVIPGSTYEVHGILMDAETGLPLLSGEGADKVGEDELTDFWHELCDLTGITSAKPLDEDFDLFAAIGGLFGQTDEDGDGDEVWFPQVEPDWEGIAALLEDNPEIAEHLSTATETFEADKDHGEIEMDFGLDASDLAGKKAVVFELLVKDGIAVGAHSDLADEDQTVTIVPSTIGTEATDKTDGDHEVMVSKEVTIVDAVHYENLLPGKEYTVKGVLMDKSTGKPLMVGDKKVEASASFTPNKPNGTVELEFTFDATGLEDKEVVAFETLYKDGIEVATHADIDDAAQTVKFVKPPKGGVYDKTGNMLSGYGWVAALLVVAAVAGAGYAGKQYLDARKEKDGDADGGES